MPRSLKTPETLIYMVSLWITVSCNAGYWHVIAADHPPGALPSLLYFACFFILTVGLISFVLSILAVGRATRFVLGVSLLVAAGASYFTARYGVLFDPGMLTNVVETNPAEALELMTPSLLATVAVVGLVPAIIIWRHTSEPRNPSIAIMHRSVALAIAVSLIVGPLLANQKEIFSVARNHRELRHMIAPLNVVSATYVSVRDSLEAPPEYHPIAVDVVHQSATLQHRKPLVHVLIVGETARASNFQLNGYALNTNPELGRKDGIQFLEANSCGTATAVSLPCMFSIQEREKFDRDQSNYEDNLLDVAVRSGYDVAWIDNGNGCKGICARVENRDVHLSNAGNICPDGSCYDEILVEELRHILDRATKDTLVVLHGLGSHGPAYFRRYPDAFRVFQPDCRSPNFGDCSQQEISNAYDNTIAYTDHIISAAIDALASHSNDLDTSLIYVSDHGESLGEHGIYLHGMPYKLAPVAQTTVPMIFWLGGHAPSPHKKLSACVDSTPAGTISHDNLFHTELGLLEISTTEYKPELDIFSRCRPATRSLTAA